MNETLDAFVERLKWNLNRGEEYDPDVAYMRSEIGARETDLRAEWDVERARLRAMVIERVLLGGDKRSMAARSWHGRAINALGCQTLTEVRALAELAEAAPRETPTCARCGGWKRIPNPVAYPGPYDPCPDCASAPTGDAS